MGIHQEPRFLGLILVRRAEIGKPGPF